MQLVDMRGAHEIQNGTHSKRVQGEQMFVEITEKGSILISAETPAEAFALKHLIGYTPCEECGQVKMPIVIDLSVITQVCVAEELG